MIRLLIFLLLVSLTYAKDPLPRGPQFGAQLRPATDAELLAVNQAFGQGLVLPMILPNSSAADGGLEVGDILLTADGKALQTSADLTGLIKELGPGAKVKLELMRGSKKLSKSVTLKERPRETSEEFEILHDAVNIDGHLRRVVFTKPHGEGPFPLVVLCPGLGCYSVDPLAASMESYKEILWELTRQGFATLRVEFTGMGDSQGPPCAEMSFYDEVHGFVEALKQLDKFKFADKQRIIAFGHSMGGLVGPYISTEIPLVGIVALNTSAIDWSEYELINQRRQMLLAKSPYDSIEIAAHLKLQALYLLGYSGQSADEIIAAHPELAEYLQYPVHPRFIKDLVLNNPGALWQKATGRVLFIQGTSDFVTAPEEHQYGVDLINSFRPGTAEFVTIDDMDHFMFRQPDQQASFDNMISGMPNKEFNRDIVKVVVDWCRAVAMR